MDPGDLRMSLTSSCLALLLFCSEGTSSDGLAKVLTMSLAQARLLPHPAGVLVTHP
jgi:hypothetical protein